MTMKTRAARHSCNYNRAQKNPTVHDTNIVHEFECGTLIWGVVFAISIGLMLIHAAVML